MKNKLSKLEKLVLFEFIKEKPMMIEQHYHTCEAIASYDYFIKKYAKGEVWDTLRTLKLRGYLIQKGDAYAIPTFTKYKEIRRELWCYRLKYWFSNNWKRIWRDFLVAIIIFIIGSLIVNYITENFIKKDKQMIINIDKIEVINKNKSKIINN